MTRPSKNWFPHWRAWHYVHLALLGLLPAFWLFQRDAAMPPLASLMSWLLIVSAITMLAERLLPYRQDWHPSGRDCMRDGSLFAINSVADTLGDVLIAVLAIAWFAAPNQWPPGLQIVLGLVLAELGAYLAHRASHAGGFLWKTHVAHHLPAALNASNSFNAHPLNTLINKLARMAPLAFLGLSADAILFVALFGLMQGIVVHANIRGRMGFLNLIVGSSELHRLHHSVRLDQARNFGTSLPLWDLVFGSFRWDEEVSQVGVTEPDGYPPTHDLWAQLLLPVCPARPGRQQSICKRTSTQAGAG